MKFEIVDDTFSMDSAEDHGIDPYTGLVNGAKRRNGNDVPWIAEPY